VAPPNSRSKTMRGFTSLIAGVVAFFHETLLE
jgi:hypothetical protein